MQPREWGRVGSQQWFENSFSYNKMRNKHFEFHVALKKGSFSFYRDQIQQQ